MSRTRSLRPGFFKNDLLAELPFEARLLFAGLWTLADKKGRLEDRPKKIKMEIFPADEVDTNGLLTQLADKKFITRYEVEGEGYIQVNKFLDHQHPHPKEPESLIPDQPKAVVSNGKPRLSRVKEDIAVKEGKEEEVMVVLGEGCGEGDEVPAWTVGFYETFRAEWGRRYKGQDYADVRKSADFVLLARLRDNKAFTPENWAVACQNYLATPQKSHTMADLANNFSTFLANPIDRYNKPVSAKEKPNARPGYGDKQNTAIRDALSAVGIGSVDNPDVVGVERRLQAPSASRGGTGVDEGELETGARECPGPISHAVLRDGGSPTYGYIRPERLRS